MNSCCRVCILTSVHKPTDIRIYEKEAKSLASMGYEVVIVAPHEQDDNSHGVRIRALPVRNKRYSRMTATLWEMYRAALSESAAVYHFHDPELVPVGLLLKLHRKRVVYDVHEDVSSDVLYKHWIPPWLRKPLARAAGLIEVSCAFCMDGVVAATPAIASRFRKEHTIVVRNYPIPGELQAQTGRKYDERAMLFAYIGGISKTRGMSEIVEALSLLPPSLQVRCDIAGEFETPDFRRQLSASPGWASVNYLGWQARRGVAEVLSRARAGLLTLQPATSFLESLPIKLFEYMSAGLPVIASNFPLWRKIIDSAGCGITVDPTDTRAIADAMLWILEHPREAEQMGQKGVEAVCSTYNWEREEATLLNLYSHLFPRTRQATMA